MPINKVGYVYSWRCGDKRAGLYGVAPNVRGCMGLRRGDAQNKERARPRALHDTCQ